MSVDEGSRPFFRTHCPQGCLLCGCSARILRYMQVPHTTARLSAWVDVRVQLGCETHTTAASGSTLQPSDSRGTSQTCSCRERRPTAASASSHHYFPACIQSPRPSTSISSTASQSLSARLQTISSGGSTLAGSGCIPTTICPRANVSQGPAVTAGGRCGCHTDPGADRVGVATTLGVILRLATPAGSESPSSAHDTSLIAYLSGICILRVSSGGILGGGPRYGAHRCPGRGCRRSSQRQAQCGPNPPSKWHVGLFGIQSRSSHAAGFRHGPVASGCVWMAELYIP